MTGWLLLQEKATHLGDIVLRQQAQNLALQRELASLRAAAGEGAPPAAGLAAAMAQLGQQLGTQAEELERALREPAAGEGAHHRVLCWGARSAPVAHRAAAGCAPPGPPPRPALAPALAPATLQGLPASSWLSCSAPTGSCSARCAPSRRSSPPPPQARAPLPARPRTALRWGT